MLIRTSPPPLLRLSVVASLQASWYEVDLWGTPKYTHMCMGMCEGLRVLYLK